VVTQEERASVVGEREHVVVPGSCGSGTRYFCL
jgi:hypothetical protein